MRIDLDSGCAFESGGFEPDGLSAAASADLEESCHHPPIILP
ncbi:MAG TPA: hypothetical protein VNL91_01510 [Thermoanaerobaculia bacterium]|nr:hypothetical protein [Thermoanaerobaculia bacterium]